VGKINNKDLISSKKGSTLKQDVERGIPLLSICGGYQLLGEYYKSGKGSILKGVGLFPAFTLASERRMIGNIIVDPDTQFDIPIIKNTNQVINKPTNRLLVGFENHSGKTYLEKGATPLGKVLNGFGNNGEDKTEGCVYKNAIGCYMHGSLLPKNPQLTDFLIKKALEVKYGKKISLKFLDDSLETQAHQKAVNLFA
jgi:lipid II isoglutaminyl synthase (glutamine-hydrolysing)